MNTPTLSRNLFITGFRDRYGVEFRPHWDKSELWQEIAEACPDPRQLSRDLRRFFQQTAVEPMANPEAFLDWRNADKCVPAGDHDAEKGGEQ